MLSFFPAYIWKIKFLIVILQSSNSFNNALIFFSFPMRKSYFIPCLKKIIIITGYPWLTGTFISCHSEVIQHQGQILLLQHVWSWNSKFLSSVRSLSCNFKIPKNYHSICFRTMYFYLDKHTTTDFLTYNIYIDKGNRQLCYYLLKRSYRTSQGSMSNFFSFQKEPPFLFQVFWILFHMFKSIPWKWDKRKKSKAEAGSSESGQMERAWHIKHKEHMNHWKPVGLIKGRSRQTHNNVKSKDDSKQVIRQEGKRTVRRNLGHQTERTRTSWASKSRWSRSFQ